MTGFKQLGGSVAMLESNDELGCLIHCSSVVLKGDKKNRRAGAVQLLVLSTGAATSGAISLLEGESGGGDGAPVKVRGCDSGAARGV